jgi:hypothetical protein
MLAPARAQDPKLDEATLGAELKALQAEHEAKSREFMKPFYDAKTDEERANVQLDWSKQPSATFVPRFADLARRAKGTEIGLQATRFVLEHATDASGGALKAALDALGDDYLESPALEKVVPYVTYKVRVVGYESVASVLSTIAGRSTRRGTKAAALLTLAQVDENNGRLGDASALYARIANDFAETPQGARAKSRLFVVEHLLVGKVAPDFEAEDETGKKFKLSDYRGKVVVIDFWGFW